MPRGTRKITLATSGMRSNSCPKCVERALAGLKEVVNARVSLIRAQAVIECAVAGNHAQDDVELVVTPALKVVNKVGY